VWKVVNGLIVGLIGDRRLTDFGVVAVRSELAVDSRWKRSFFFVVDRVEFWPVEL
jgi:hypothetical protein